MSTRSPGLKYTAQGLGDRIHLVSLCYEISKTQSEIVTLHLARNHLGGKKRDSFLEILNMFPNSFVELRFHESEFQTTTEWKNYLTQEGILALSFEYRDHPGWLERPSDIDASHFLYKRHLLQPSCEHKLRLPTEFVTVQWDSTGKDRQLPGHEISKIEKGYLDSGLEVIRLGGQSTEDLLRDCLTCSASAIYKSRYFAGVDSGFLHLALQIKNPSQIHFYTARNRYWSHHTFRAIEMGSVVNYHSRKLNTIDFIYTKLRYDSPRLMRKVHKLRQLAGIERYETHD
jgi:hypothetical protein